MKFSIKDFFSKCDQISRKLRIWSRLLKKSLMEIFIFCAMFFTLFHDFFPAIVGEKCLPIHLRNIFSLFIIMHDKWLYRQYMLSNVRKIIFW